VRNAAKTAQINHPRRGDQVVRRFAAFGTATGIKEVFGLLKHQNGTKYSGHTLVSPLQSDTGFWIIHFVRGDFPISNSEDVYTLEVFDADDIAGGRIGHVVGLTFHPLFGGSVVISYPQPNNQVCDNFAAYGTAPGSLDVTSILTNKIKVIEASPGPDWVLHCQVNDGGHDLTVDQTGADPAGPCHFTSPTAGC
jgi:hypothetical protein